MMNTKAGIVITTRNREQDLEKLLALLKAEPYWAKLPIWVHDDASDQVSEDYWPTIQTHGILIRNQQRKGYIVNRNISNASAPFEFIFSLDDDSCFVDPEGPEQAIAYLEAHPRVAALSFPLVNSLNPPPVQSIQPYPCFSYIGCAHLIRRTVFTQLGGYRDDFIHQGEESELCARIWTAGYKVHAFPACRVHHWVSLTSRNYRRIGFYGPRNRVWNHLLHTPLRVLPFEIIRALGSSMRLSLTTKLPIVHLSGWVDGLRQGILTWHQRQALPMSLYREITALPIFATEPQKPF